MNLTDPQIQNFIQLSQSKNHDTNRQSQRITKTPQKLPKPYQFTKTPPRNQQILQKFIAYQPQNSLFEFKRMKKLDNVKIKQYKDSIYFGQQINGNKHGQGILLYDNGRVYEGDFENDHKNGDGIEIFQNKAKYVGQYKNNKPEGFGKYYWPNGEYYEGQWVNGYKHGSGMWKGVRNDSYMGQWKQGKPNGYGVHIWNDDKYEGEFQNCLKHGQGSEYFNNGDIYIGQYVNGKPEGYGEYFWANGSEFKGQFKNGLRHGHGKWVKKGDQQDIYEGEYVNDKKCGYGAYQWGTGNVYKGNFFDDLRHGYGEMYWGDGSYYKGQWEKGYQFGEGEICDKQDDKNRDERFGIFEKNVLVEDLNSQMNIRSQSIDNQLSSLKIYSYSKQRQGQQLIEISKMPTMSQVLTRPSTSKNSTWYRSTKTGEFGGQRFVVNRKKTYSSTIRSYSKQMSRPQTGQQNCRNRTNSMNYYNLRSEKKQFNKSLHFEQMELQNYLE